LIEGLKDLNDPHVRGRAALALAEMRAAAKKAVPNLVTALKDDNAQVRYKAAFALAAIGTAAKDTDVQLRPALKDGDAKVRLYAARALWDLRRHPDGIDVFITELTHPDHEIRLTAAVALLTVAQQQGKPPLPALLAAVPELTRALKDRDVDVRSYAAFAL